ncbi:aarF domain-containing kinase [Ilyonectria robusta]
MGDLVTYKVLSEFDKDAAILLQDYQSPLSASLVTRIQQLSLLARVLDGRSRIQRRPVAATSLAQSPCAEWLIDGVLVDADRQGGRHPPCSLGGLISVLDVLRERKRSCGYCRRARRGVEHDPAGASPAAIAPARPPPRGETPCADVLEGFTANQLVSAGRAGPWSSANAGGEGRDRGGKDVHLAAGALNCGNKCATERDSSF